MADPQLLFKTLTKYADLMDQLAHENGFVSKQETLDIAMDLRNLALVAKVQEETFMQILNKMQDTAK